MIGSRCSGQWCGVAEASSGLAGSAVFDNAHFRVPVASCEDQYLRLVPPPLSGLTTLVRKESNASVQGPTL
jgi:hypothetical protein